MFEITQEMARDNLGVTVLGGIEIRSLPIRAADEWVKLSRKVAELDGELLKKRQALLLDASLLDVERAEGLLKLEAGQGEVFAKIKEAVADYLEKDKGQRIKCLSNRFAVLATRSVGHRRTKDKIMKQFVWTIFPGRRCWMRFM